MHPSRSLVAGTLAALLLLPGCRASLPRSGAATPTPHVRVYDARASRWVGFEAMTRAAAQADMVFLGEQHDDPVTHAVELAVLAALGVQRGQVVLSLEMFERDVQPLLDRYLAGAMTERDFLATARPWDRYVTDYRPLVELARVRGWPVIAANVPRPIASAVSRRGLAHLDTLNATQRAFAAQSNHCPRDAYFDRFAETVGAHGAAGAAPAADATASARAMTERFYEAQCVKDEAMGEAVAGAFARHRRNAPVLHVDGAFHSDFGQGTVERARRRAPEARVLVISAIPVPDPATADPRAHARRADFLVFTRASRGP